MSQCSSNLHLLGISLVRHCHCTTHVSIPLRHTTRLVVAPPGHHLHLSYWVQPTRAAHLPTAGLASHNCWIATAKSIADNMHTVIGCGNLIKKALVQHHDSCTMLRTPAPTKLCPTTAIDAACGPTTAINAACRLGRPLLMDMAQKVQANLNVL